MQKTRQQRRKPQVHKIDEYLRNSKKQKKQHKEIQKYAPSKQNGTVGAQLRRVLLPHRARIMEGLNWHELEQQVQQYCQPESMYLASLLYLSVTKMSDQWSEIYTPETPEDFLDDENQNCLEHWLMNSYQVLRNARSHQSESDDSNAVLSPYETGLSVGEVAKGWQYRILNFYGGTGKQSQIEAISRHKEIEVIQTHSSTEKKSFEELLQSQSVKGMQGKRETMKKVIVHKGKLPKPIDKLMKDQRVPIIWVSDQPIESSETKRFSVDKLELIQYKHKQIVDYIYQILLLQLNYRNQLDEINQQFKEKVLFETLQFQGCFYKNFGIPKPTIEITALKCDLTYDQLSDLVIAMNGNIRKSLNWLQFYYFDDNFHDQLNLMLETQLPNLDYKIKNHLPIYNFDRYSFEDAEEQEIVQCNQIIRERIRLFRHYKLKAFLPTISDYSLLNSALQTLANHSAQNSRLRKPVEHDPFKALAAVFPDITRYKAYDELTFMLYDAPLHFPASKSFSVLGLLALSLIYAKLTVSLYVPWTFVLSPLTLFFSYKFVRSVLSMRRPLPRNHALWNICQLLITAPLAVATFYLGILIERLAGNQDAAAIQDTLKHLFACIAFAQLVYMLYSYKSGQSTQDGVVMNFFLSTFGNTVNFCAGGACNSFYMSTLSAFFSAFGIPIAQYIHYLNYLCVILLAFSLLSLYSVKASVFYAPFLLTAAGAVMILVDMFVYDFDYATYAGNLLIIGSALWNSRLNKFSFGRRKV